MSAKLTEFNDHSSLGRQIELYLDDRFVCSFSYFEIPDNIKSRVLRLINAAVEITEYNTKEKTQLEIRSALGCKE